MIDLQVATDGAGKLRARHSGGTEGIIMSLRWASDGPIWRGADGYERRLSPPVVWITIALDDRGVLEAPQSSFEAVR